MFPRISAALLLAVLVAACGGTPPATDAPTATPTPVAAPTQAAEPTQAPLPTLPSQPTDAPPASLLPDLPLEELYPDQVGGLDIEVRSAQGASVRDLFPSDDDSELDQFLADMGTTIDNVSAAFSFAFGPGATQDEFVGISILALRVRDVPSGEVLQNFVALVQRETPDSEVRSETIGGKGVTTVVDPEDENGTVHLYAVGDVVFIVGGTPALVEEALGQLP